MNTSKNFTLSNGMTLEQYNERAKLLDEEFKVMKKIMIDSLKQDDKLTAEINSIDKTAVHKFLMYTGDISPARLLSISSKILMKK